MIQQVLLAIGLTGVTVILHAGGTAYFLRPTAFLRRADSTNEPRSAALTMTFLICALLVLHLLEMVVWGVAFMLFAVLPDFETALYYSLTSYTTVGYGDVVPPTQYRLLGPMEAAVGILMLGWSTGIIVAVVQRLYVRRATRATASHQE